MTNKDWIILLVPILFNGVFIFILQKVFERKQDIKTIKKRYLFKFLNAIDDCLIIGLSIYRLQREEERDDAKQMKLLFEYKNRLLNLYYNYYQPNHTIFKSYVSNIKTFNDNIKSWVNYHNKIADEGGIITDSKAETYDKIFDSIMDELFNIKTKCIKLKF